MTRDKCMGEVEGGSKQLKRGNEKTRRLDI